MASKNSIKIPPYHYIHILDRNTNISRVEIGPQTFIRQDHEVFSTGDKPLKMVILPPRHYCEITNPVIRDKDGQLTRDRYGQINVNFGEVELRFAEKYPDPFPLYPKEELSQKPTALRVVKELTALKIEALRNFKDDQGVERNAGEEWLFKGPATYYPRIEETVVREIAACIISDQQALRLKARQNTTDVYGVERKTGEEWLIRKPGAYLPQVFEEVLELQQPFILNNRTALHLKATQKFTDVYGKERKAGEQWLVFSAMSSHHVIDVYEEFVSVVNITVLTKQQYCVVLNPLDPSTGKNKYGSRDLRKGETSFFLQPDEELEGGIKSVYILEDTQALLLRAKEKITETVVVKDSEEGSEKLVVHEPGDKWMVYGPCSYIPPVEVEVVETRKKIPLDKNEGVYVRDARSGLVRIVLGETYMLKAHEELWDMDLPETVEKLINNQLVGQKKGLREKSKVVTYKCAYNSAVQVYDYKKKTARIIFGPELVILGPDEQFTITSLSGGKPKRPGVIHAIEIMMGPDFTSDIIVVETSDHASLRIQLSYNWYFRVNDKKNQEEAGKIFQVKDFIGDLCNIMASKVRGAVASVDFDTFHKTSARLIRKAIFGFDEAGHIRDDFVLAKNNLVVTNVDIKSVEPVDENTRLSLQKTVTMAIEITTKRQEASARHAADKLEQEARGELEKLKIEDQSKAEAAKKKLLEMEAKSQAVSGQGLAIAEAIARAEAEEISAKSRLESARLAAKARKVEKDAELEQRVKRENAVLEHEKLMSELEINRQKDLGVIESKKFEEMIDAIGKETIIAMAQAGPETQAQLLKGLGLQGFIMTDGNNPINLFQTAGGLIGVKDEEMS